MDIFEAGKILGKIEVLLEDIPDKEQELNKLERVLRYDFAIMDLAEMYGRIEQKMIIANKSENAINELGKIFKDIRKEHIKAFKKLKIEELRLRGFPIKALHNNNIFIVEDICDKTFEEISSMTGISNISARMLVGMLREHGIELKK